MKNKQLEELQNNSQVDEIDLFELFASLGRQWKWLVGITLLGALMSAVVAFMLPKTYEVTAQVTVPSTLDARLITNEGYTEFDSSQLFEQFLAVLNTPNEFNTFVKQGGWIEKLNLEGVKNLTEAFQLQELRKSLVINVIEPKLTKGAQPSTVKITQVMIEGEDEAMLVAFVNQFIEYVGYKLFHNIKKNGQGLVSAEIKKINHEIALLRSNYKRDIDIRMLVLKEALVLAEKVGIKKPDSVRLYSQEEDQGLAGLTAKSSLFLMGSAYLKGEIETISRRTSTDAFIPEVSKLKIQLEKLSSLTFDFTAAVPYKQIRMAEVDGKAERPKRELIIAVGAILAFILSLFTVLVMGSVHRHRTLIGDVKTPGNIAS